MNRKFEKWRLAGRALFLTGIATVLSTMSAGTEAQQGAGQSPETISGFGAQTDVPMVRPGPRGEVDTLVKSLSTNDAAMEVIVGQGRLMTLNLDIVAPGRPKPLIAVGDPSVIAAELVGIRQLRIVGDRIGVTDLAITTPDGRTYSFEVRVVADLDVLRAQLKALFPRENLKKRIPGLEDLKLYQIRDHIVVEGFVSDVMEGERIIATIRAYLESIKISQARKVRAESIELEAGRGGKGTPPKAGAAGEEGGGEPKGEAPPADVSPERARLNIEAQIAQPQIINLLRVPEAAPPEDPLVLLEYKLKEKFPTASVKLQWVGDLAAVEGQARDSQQVAMIVQTVNEYLEWAARASAGGASDAKMASKEASQQTTQSTDDPAAQSTAAPASTPRQRVINLLQVPGPQQVLLKVEVAELNRTGMRQIGMSWFLKDQITFIGSNTSGAYTPFAREGATGRLIQPFTNPSTTIAGARLSTNGSFQYWMDALRRNSLLKILAEPNLVAMNGHEASFLAGGEFPVPVPQGGAGALTTITIEYKKFGVRLSFVPTILDEDRIRLSVDPEVSSIDFDLGIVQQGFRVPGLNSRQAHTVVELRQGQTLAMAGLIQLDMTATTRRIPGLGDLPVLGPFFSNNTGERVEKELIVLVTPFLVDAMEPDQLPGRPGDEVKEPNDLEFYLLGRIEARTGRDFRSSTQWDDPLHFVELLKLERNYISGPSGFSD